MSRMIGVTIKLPDTTVRQLRHEAKAAGRSVSALVRERLDARLDRGKRSVYAVTSDLAGSAAGSRNSATNDRRRFGR